MLVINRDKAGEVFCNLNYSSVLIFDRQREALCHYDSEGLSFPFVCDVTGHVCEEFRLLVESKRLRNQTAIILLRREQVISRNLTVRDKRSTVKHLNLKSRREANGNYTFKATTFIEQVIA